jgi:hypothetical protein
LQYDENFKVVGFKDVLCQECAKKENKELNSIV